ncbi:DUF4007 family protein [Formosa algae]|uniref:DUF4007 domain-containing protein n=1 Tax=Formosa algae TaxID=225843 RepID=A0A9X1C830_9FLAO|nr:DUF4007 family protein [Formosa algae]MBP1838621.1 hypothetical protein [Formosa algae]MDQ0335121.1 hypothetical protein [Formosa algae]OEI80464.1 hypothetical protein AST99_09070 [Formosa algae]
MTSNQESLRFSGHDTFHCKEQWILKGVQLIDNQGGLDIFKMNEAIPLLGVGKNMVRSIQHWLKAFGMLNKEDVLTEFANLLFLTEKLDPYLENEGSLWLLQYYLCKTNHSSIFQLIFSSYFSDKATLEFSEYQILNYVNRILVDNDQKEVAEKTFNSDFKVFIRTFVSPVKNEKTVEDDFNAPLLGLNLVSDTGRKNAVNQTVYRLNRNTQESISSDVFAYCLLNEFEDENAVSFDRVRKTVGSYLCLSNEGLEIQIDKLCEENNQFVYKDDAGVRQLQFKNNSNEFKNNMLKNHYGVH